MGYGSRNIGGSSSEPMVTIRGQGPVQRVSPFTESSHISRAGADYLHQNPFSRSPLVPEKRESKGPSPTEDIKARYTAMREKMHKVMAERGSSERTNPETPEDTNDDFLATPEDLQIWEKLNGRGEHIEVGPVDQDLPADEVVAIATQYAEILTAPPEDDLQKSFLVNEEASCQLHGITGTPKNTGRGRPKSQKTLDREADETALKEAARLYENTYGRY